MQLKNSMSRLRWLANRLAAMSGPEIAYRLHEQSKRIASRFSHPDFSKIQQGWNELPGLPIMEESMAGLADEGAVLAQWEDIALRARSGRYFFLGQEWPGIQDDTKWHIDPVTASSWPSDDFCFSIPYRHTSSKGDVKYVWELNRLQHLQPIACLAAIRKDEALARFCGHEIESWIDSNPPFQGINWTSGIELACRTVSILVVLSLVGNIAFTDEQRVKLRQTLAAHGYWLMRFPSRYSSANNHLVAEASGLYLLGTLFTDLKGAHRWSEYGRNTLVREAGKQILDDGVGAEQSPTYTAFTLEWLMLCGKVAELFEKPFPAPYYERLGKAGEFLCWITDNRGNQPSIGDNDEGCVFYSQRMAKQYTTSVLGSLAGVIGRQEFGPAVRIPHLREIFLGKAAIAKENPAGSRCFETGGYTVLRSDAYGAECLLVMDHGPLGYLSIAAHGHADHLAVWLHLDGKPVLVDGGTYLYHSGGAWREHMRSTHAHNTLSINGTSSSTTAGSFNWAECAEAILLHYRKSTDGLFMVEAEHDGFLKSFHAIHRRRIEQTGPGAFSVYDTMYGNSGNLPVEIGFLFHPELTLNESGRTWSVYRGNTPVLELTATRKGFSGHLQKGEENPLRGWFSSQFGSIEPSPRLVFKGLLSDNATSEIRFIIPDSHGEPIPKDPA